MVVQKQCNVALALVRGLEHASLERRDIQADVCTQAHTHTRTNL